MFKPFSDAVGDFISAWRYRAVWLALASEDITDQHRRTTLGPVWLLFNYLAFAGTFVVIFSHPDSKENFAAYVAIGLLVWLFLSEVVTQAVTLFVREENFIKGTLMPLSIYVMRMSMQSYIRLGYSMAGCVAIVLLTGSEPALPWLWALLAMAVVLLVVPPAITIFAIAGAYFPDIQFFVSNIMRIGMFLTPIFWHAGAGSGIRMHLYRWNPFSYFLESVRGPILDGTPHLNALAICAAICAGLWILAMWLLGSLRKQIVFVL